MSQMPIQPVPQESSLVRDVTKDPKSENREYVAFIHGAINDIYMYLDILELLFTANEGDVIKIFIDSPGGFINTGATISDAILRCKAEVITVATGICASAASLIWSNGDKCIYTPTAMFMWHMSSHADFGNSLAIKTSAVHQVEFVRTNLLQMSRTKGFITEEEVTKICSDPSYVLWIGADEMTNRLGGKDDE